ncbi:TolC family outer membrane protein [Pseudoroseicyclus sp. CXY001]|uniref:TolC family outer membrane protein n=1 Tax=Pseudoroseicyclus sp. CXY001 TaxID=3242492 RepID=UPI0035714514
MKSWGRRLAAAALFALPLGNAATAETLADALAYGYEHSGLLEQNRALLRAADEDVAQANAALLPVVSWSATASSTLQDQPGADLVSANLQLSAQLTLYDGGANRLAVEATKENVLATRASLVGIEQQVLMRIVEAYFNLRRAQEFVALRENNVSLITRELRAARDRFEVGEITRTDVSLAEARLAAARSLYAAEQGTLVRAVYEFQVAVGREPGSLEWAGPAPINRSLADAKAWALRNHPSIIQSQHSVAAAELGIERGEAALRPTLGLSGGVGVDRDGNTGRTVQLQLSGPIYQGGRLSSAIRQLMQRRDAARSQLLITAQGVEQGVGNAWAYLEVARASREAYQRQVEASTVGFNGVREEAELGSRTTLDVLNAEQELLDARTNLISAEVDEAIASYGVLSAMGLLTAEDLGLNVQVYDPEAYYSLVEGAPTRLSAQGQALDRVLEAIGRE